MKKAQVKFGETFAVIIVVYIIIVIGSVWYNNINLGDLENLRQDDQVNRAFERYHFLTNLDLIRVSQRGIIENTYNIHSLRTFKNFSQNEGSEYIRRNLGEANITLFLYNSSIYKDDDVLPFETIQIYNFSLTQREQREVFWSSIPVKDPTKRSNSTYIGILRVEIPFN